MTLLQGDKILDFGVLVVSCNIVQLCFAVVFSLGRRTLSRLHDILENCLGFRSFVKSEVVSPNDAVRSVKWFDDCVF